ncbi:MAG: AsmA family protein [Geminicoccaceae bacterium]
MRRLGAVVLGLLLLASAAGAFLLATLDPNDHKALIEQWASDALGRTVRIEGPIELTRSLTPTLVVNNLSMSGAGATSDAATAAAVVSIGRAELSLVLTSLLFGPLHLPHIAVDTAQLDLPLQGGLPASDGDAQVPRIDQITLSNITIRYQRDVGDPFVGVVERATFAPAASATTLDITGTIGKVPLHLAGTTGTVAALFAGGRDWPLEADATLGEGKLGFSGKLGLQGAQLLFTLDANIDLPASTAAALAIPALPLQATTKLHGDAASFTAQGLVATYGNSDLQGDLTWQQGARAKLSGKVTAKRIVLAELLPQVDGASGGDVVPNPPMLTPALMPMDLDLDASVGQLDLAPGHAATDLMITTRGSEREMDLTLAQAKLGTGQVQAHYKVQGEGPSTDIAFKLGVRDLDLTSVFGEPGGGNKLPKDVQVALDLTGRGIDLHAFLGSANGPIAITTGPAVLDETFVNLLGQSLFTAIIPDFKRSRGAHIICSVLDLQAKDGKASSTALVIDGKHVVVGGGGAIELASGKIDFVLMPTAKDMTLAPLVAPVHLAGTITDPQVMDDAGDILSGTGHLLLGIVNPLSLATPILHPNRSGDMPCRDPGAFAGGQQGPVERAGQGAVDAVEGVGHGIGSAIEDLGKGASDLLDDIMGR